MNSALDLGTCCPKLETNFALLHPLLEFLNTTDTHILEGMGVVYLTYIYHEDQV